MSESSHHEVAQAAVIREDNISFHFQNILSFPDSDKQSITRSLHKHLRNKFEQTNKTEAAPGNNGER